MADLTPGASAPPWSFIEWVGTIAGSGLLAAFGFGWRVRSHGQKLKLHEADIVELKAFRIAAVAQAAAVKAHARDIEDLKAFRHATEKAQGASPTRDQIREDMRDLGKMIGDRFDGVERRLDTVDERMGRLDTRVDQLAVKS